VLRFEYVAPGTMKEAVAILGANHSARILAGGTDLLLQQRHDPRWRGDLVVDIKRVRNSDELRLDEKRGLTIGPAATMGQVEAAHAVRQVYPALVQGAEVVGSVQIRNRATVVGNICNAAPSADTAPGLIVLGGRVRIAGPEGRRSVPVERLFVGPGRVALQPGELVTAIQVPAPRPRSGSAYARHTTRESMDIAVAGVAAAVELNEDGSACRKVRIAMAAVAPTPVRALGAERAMLRGEVSDELLDQAATTAAQECQPISDVRASAEFRRELVRVLTRRMVAAAIADARARFGKGGS